MRMAPAAALAARRVALGAVHATPATPVVWLGLLGMLTILGGRVAWSPAASRARWLARRPRPPRPDAVRVPSARAPRGRPLLVHGARGAPAAAAP